MSKLYSSLNMGELQLGHRLVVLSPDDYAGTSTMGGLIISEPCAVSSDVGPRAPRRRLDTREDIEDWRRITGAVHGRGGIIVLRIVHSGSANSTLATTLDGAGIDAIIADYAACAHRGMLAGFDGVELDASSGNLPDQFLCDRVNAREDRWGGCIENRIHFLSEIVQALADVCGRTRVGVRVSPYRAFSGMGDSDPAALFTALLSVLSDQEIAYVHIVRPLFNVDVATTKRFRAAFPDVILLSGNYTLQSALTCIEFRWADAIGFDSAFPNLSLARR